MRKKRKKYRKSWRQRQKELARRRKLRDFVLSLQQYFTQTELAEMLGCSQATVSRDLKKLRGTRWDPFKRLEEIERERIMDLLKNKRKQAMNMINGMTDSQAIAAFIHYMKAGEF